MVKIYINDQYLLLTTDGDAAPAVKPNYRTLIREIESSNTSRTVVTNNVLEDLEEIKALYVVIQAGGGFVTTADGAVLLIHRKGKWDLPKGKLEEGEDLAICALREVEEETGLRDIALQEKLCITYHTYFEKGKNILKESHWYRMQVRDAQDLTPQSEEGIEQCLWVPFGKIASYHDGAHASIRDVLKAGIATLIEE